jgi:hypothetical protein
MLAIRVAATILFGAFALWSQTTETAAANSEQLSNTEIEQNDQSAPMHTNQFTFKLPIPESLAAGRKEFEVAENLPPLFLPEPSQVKAGPSRAVNYSNGFFVRRKIHKYASIATLPLLASEAIVGQKLLDGNNNDSLRSAHSGLAAGVGVLFGVETVTGLWNMMETRKVPVGHKKKLVHGLLMLAADAGFVATAASAPHREERESRNIGNASTHKAIAYSSIGIATVGYLYKLLAK